MVFHAFEVPTYVNSAAIICIFFVLCNHGRLITLVVIVVESHTGYDVIFLVRLGFSVIAVSKHLRRRSQTVRFPYVFFMYLLRICHRENAFSFCIDLVGYGESSFCVPNEWKAMTSFTSGVEHFPFFRVELLSHVAYCSHERLSELVVYGT